MCTYVSVLIRHTPRHCWVNPDHGLILNIELVPLYPSLILAAFDIQQFTYLLSDLAHCRDSI